MRCGACGSASAAAIVLCLAVGIALEALDRNLPQRQQEMLETVVALVAVAMVTYMIVFMRRHARHLRGELESRAGVALAAGSATALVRDGVPRGDARGPRNLGVPARRVRVVAIARGKRHGRILGIVVAVIIGWGIYKGGMRINLARFFTVTGLVLVVVAAGLLSFAAHTAHEAAWLHVGQSRAADLSGFVKPGSVQSALVTGVLGIQPRPVWAEVIVFFAYLIPMSLYVAWPRKATPTSRPSTPSPAPRCGLTTLNRSTSCPVRR